MAARLLPEAAGGEEAHLSLPLAAQVCSASARVFKPACSNVFDNEPRRLRLHRYARRPCATGGCATTDCAEPFPSFPSTRRSAQGSAQYGRQPAATPHRQGAPASLSPRAACALISLCVPSRVPKAGDAAADERARCVCGGAGSVCFALRRRIGCGGVGALRLAGSARPYALRALRRGPWHSSGMQRGAVRRRFRTCRPTVS